MRDGKAAKRCPQGPPLPLPQRAAQLDHLRLTHMSYRCAQQRVAHITNIDNTICSHESQQAKVRGREMTFANRLPFCSALKRTPATQIVQRNI